MALVAEYPRFVGCIVGQVVRYLRILYFFRDSLRYWRWRHRRRHLERTVVVVVVIAGIVAVAVVHFVEDWEECIERYGVEFVEKYAKRYTNANSVLDLQHLLRRREEYVVPFQLIEVSEVRN